MQIPLNTKDISQEFLNIDNKDRSNPLPWNGQFSPQLIEVLLRTYADEDSAVLDPFGGSGTLLHEAAVCGLRGEVADINPAACYLARLYTLANQSMSARRKLVCQLDEMLPNLISEDMPLFDSRDSASDLKRRAADLRRALGTNSEAWQTLNTLLILSDFMKEGQTSKDVVLAWKRLRLLILNFPYSTKPLKVWNRDARKLPLKDGAIGLVITSPPYINVFNYHQNYRTSTEAFGWNLLNVAKSEIGSNRKNRGNRFLTVTQYCLDLSQVFSELSRVCARNSRIIFVVGRESQVLGVPFYNSLIINSVATKVARYRLLTRQERVFRNRFGQNIFEDILHFAPPSVADETLLDEAREIAYDALKNGIKTADEAVKVLIEDAIRRIPEVAPSPLYDCSEAMSEKQKRED